MIDNNTTEKKYISQVVLPPIEDGGNERLYLIKDKNARDNIETLQSNLTSLNEEINTLDTKVDNLDIPDISNLVTTDNLNNKISNLITKNELDNTYVKWSALASNYSNNSVLNNNYAHTTNGIIDNATVNYTDVNNLYDNYAHTNANGTIDNALIDYTSINNLYNNYAHINNGEIDNATIDHTNINNLEANYAHITNNIIDNANINYANVNDLDSNYAHINNGIIDNATIDFESVNNLEANYAHITNGTIDNANINQANVNDLNTNYAHINNGIIDNATIDQTKVNNLDTNYAHINNGIIDNATIDQTKINNLNANYAHISNGTIDNATIDHADINGLNTNYAHISRGVIDNATIDYANVTDLSAHYAYISDGVISNAFIDQANVNELDTHYAEIDMANVNNAWIENGVIKDAAISDAKIAGVSANKITAGTIDAANVNVINLRADNLTVTKINGQPVIGGYTLVDSFVLNYLEKNPHNEGWYELYDNSYHQTNDTIVDSNKNYYTTSESVSLYDQNTIDNMLNNINERIDSQIETWTIDTIPLLNNEPAVNWTTDDEKNEHIGDICYVVNAASDYDGFTYRFAYDNTSHQYSWVLIQDNQVTAALGRITNLESFNNQLVNWDEATDEGVITVRGRITALSGRIDKTVKSSIQLWYTKADTTTPAAPTSQVTSTSTNGGAWTTVVPIYDEDYSNYFYCWQYQYEDNTYGWSAVIYDQAITETQEAARTVPPDLLDYISDNIETIQEQVLDGQLEIWYGSINPSLNNAPVNEWSSNKYEDHIGDLYYNITNGSVWQWTENNSTYSWLQIPDSAASAALAAAQNAQATADGKRKIFTTTPTVPYDIGDLWVTGSTVKYANVAKTFSQTYSENDWSLTATDDTTANANIKSSIQLWYTSNSTTSPNKPYTDGSTNYVNSTSTNGNIWTTVVPVYNSSTPKYHYCYQQQRGDGKYQWTIPVYDDATTTAMAKAQNALSMSDFETFEQTTFKNVTDTINEQTTSITNLTTIIDNNGLTENTIITNTVNTVSQKANNNESKISSLTTALGTNEDGTSKENDIIHQVSDINQNLDSITTRVGKTEASLKGTYATSSTAANIQNKEATIFPAITNFELYKGAAITVKFINDNTISNPTLNINSSGAKPIKTYSGANLSETEYAWRAGSTMTFIYDETNWCIQDSTELTRIKANETLINQTANNVLIKATSSDSTAAQGGQHIIQSLINVAPEGIKIAADKVNIEGAAIFNSGRLSQTNLNNTYASTDSIPSDLSDLTDTTNIIPSDLSDLTDTTNIIPSDLSDLTDENNIIPDISNKADKSSAIAEEQIIYIQAVSGTNSINAYPSSATTTSSYWITQTGESIPSGTPPNSNSGQTPRWTLKRPSYQKNYPIVFVAKQRKTVSGVISCTIPIKDDTTTIIDGGHITTGTIDASQVTVNNIHADSITVGTINGNQITNGAINFDKLDSGVKDNINMISDAATSALNNLATIENVVDTLTWVTEHGTMTSTTDNTIDPTKIYFVLDNNGDYTVGNNKYSIVQEPNISNLSNYYELTIDKSVQNYIATHLSLTNEGLWLTPMATESNGCKVLVATGSGSNYPTAGTYIINRDNNNVETVVAQFTPNGISFAENKSFYIGDNNAFIRFDGNGHISIGGNGLSIGGYATDVDVTNAINNINVGGRNLLPTSLIVSDVQSGVTIAGITIVYEDDGWFRVSGTRIGTVGINIGLWSDGNYSTPAVPQLADVSGKTLTWTIETEGTPFVAGSTYETSTHIVAYGTSASNAYRFGGAFDLVQTVTPQVTHYSEIWYHIGANVPENTTVNGRFRIMLEVGNMSTAWTPAPEDIETRVSSAESAITQNSEQIALRATKTEAYQIAQPNLSPYYSSVPYESTNVYWKSIQLENGFTFTSMGDGWIRVQCTNSGSSVIRRDWYPIKCPSVVAGQPYTWLAEVRNNASSSVSSNSDFYLVQTNNLQFWGQKAIKTIEGPSGSSMSVNIGTCGSTYTLRKVQNAETADDGHWTNNDEANVIGLACWTFRCAANSTIDYEVRLSLYEGEYTGPYKPYSGTQLYASQAELKVANDNISSKVSTTDYNGQTIASLINQSAESVKIQASKVEIDGTAIFTAIGSDVDDAITSKGYATTTQAQGYADAVQDNLNASRVWYAECSTAAATAAKIATITPITTAFNLSVGTTISVKFTYANTVANPTLNVNDTGAIAIMRYGTTAPSTSAATSWQANSINTLTYDGTYWRLNNWLNDNTTYNLGRNLHATAIKVLEDVASGLLMVGTANGYVKIATGISFSLSYPLLYASAAYTANTTYTNTYETWNSVTYSSTATIQSGATNKTIYLKGNVSANTFTIDSTNVFTTVEPTSEDGYFYIPLGIMSSSTVGNFATSNSLYAYLDGKFRQVTPTEIVASQKIYYRSKMSGTVPKPTAWVALATNKYNDTVSVGNGGWSTKVTPIAASKAENVDKYLYLYTCEQRKRLDGTIECTDITLDENTTIIDGGNIITHTITAEQLNATSINASKSLTVGAMTDAAATTILNSNINVGGRNFLRDTQYMTSWGTNNDTTIVDGVVTFPTVTANTWREIWPSQNFKYDLIRDKQVTFSCEANVPSDQTSVLNLCIGLDTTETDYSRKKYRNQPVTITGTGTWQKVSVMADITDAWFTSGSGTVDYDNCWVTVRPGAQSSSWSSFQVRLFKLEVGNVATDWTLAPEDPNDAIINVASDISESIENMDETLNDFANVLETQSADIGESINEVQNQLNALKEDFESEVNAREQWLSFNSSEGLVIGENESNFKTVTTATSMEFRNGDTVLARAAGEEFSVPSLRSEELHLGNWMWIPRNNGNLALKWIGE